MTGLGQPLAFNHLTVENGLLSNSVLSIAQDRQGFLWFGTSIGLTRYDGARFRVYKSNAKDSLSLWASNITSLFCDAQNNLWIGTSNGLNRYDVARDAFERIRINGQTAGNIHCIYQDKQQRIWIGSTQGLHLLANLPSRQFISFLATGHDNSIGGNTVRAIQEDGQGNLWIGTNDGLTRMQWVDGQYHFTTFRHQPGDAGSLHANYITALALDAEHQLWIGTQHDGIHLYQPGTNRFLSWQHSSQSSGIINNNIRKLLSTSRGQLWVGTQEGLSIIDPRTKAITSYQQEAGNKTSLSQNSIYALLEDANGSVWVGTYFGGANSTYSYSTPFHTLQNNQSTASLSNNVVSSLVEDRQHNLWIGTEGGGLNYYDRSNGHFTTWKNNVADANSLGSNLVKVVYLDKDGNPWCGTHGGGLNVYDRSHHQFRRYLYKENDPASLSSEITSLTEDGMGRFWVVSQAGISLFHRNGLQLEPLDTKAILPGLPGQAYSVYTDKAGNTWIGSYQGLYVASGDHVQRIDSSYAVNCIHEDRQGIMWLGLNYGGLAGYDPTRKTYTRYGVNSGLANVNVVGILDDNDGNLWISSNQGLLRFDPTRNSLQAYTISDGLAGNEFNFNSYLKDSRGAMYFGGFNGITHFYPSLIETNRYAAPIQFTGLKLFNNYVSHHDDGQLLPQNITLAPPLTFRYNQDVFTIEFALLNYIKSNKNKYAYKLEGFDKDWNEVAVNAATYTNLPAGHYTFWVKGANNDGIWSKPASISITVLPPFWRTWWAYCFYILALGGLLFLVLRYFFLRALLKKEDELHQVKLNFFTNVSHEIRTHLTLIMTPVDKLLDDKDKDSPVHQQLSQVKNNANRLLSLVSELMDFRKAETDHLTLHFQRQNLIPFLQDIYTSFRELSLSKDIHLSFLHNTEEMFLYFDKEQLEKVFFNLLANAFKFTPTGGRIILLAEQKDNKITVTVTDNGRGIAPQFLGKLFTNFFQVADHGQQNTGYGIGLALSKHIVELHKGQISVDSAPAANGREGLTVFTVVLQQGNRHLADELTAGPVPVVQAPPAVVVSEGSPVVVPRPDTTAEKHFTLLIVEDNEQLRAIIRDTFAHQYHLLECENGLQAWDTAIEQIPDLILSDVMMPGMDGFALCEKLKTDERTSHIPVILLTAKSAQSDQVSGLETGADLYLTKPFSTRILELNVRNLLAAREKLRQRFSSQLAIPASSKQATNETVTEHVPNTVDREFLQKVIDLVEAHIDDPDFGVDMLSRKVAMSAPVLYKKIKALTNLSVNEFVKSLRLQRAATLLQQKQLTVYEVAFAVGYNDRKYFSREFKKQFGQTPSEYAEADAGGKK